MSFDIVFQVPQPVGKRHMNESDYEEIGPPPVNGKINPAAAAQKVQNGPLAATAAAPKVCDLCGTATAVVKCRLCSDQVFCLACDDMYHRHPKRSSHGRKVSF